MNDLNTNELKLSGKLLNIYRDEKTNALIAKIAVVHSHNVGTQSINVESKFTTVMTDESEISKVDAQAGDKVLLKGYIKQDFTNSNHQKNMIYATEILKL